MHTIAAPGRLMSALDRMLGFLGLERRDNLGVPPNSAALASLFGISASNIPGITVTPESALNCTAVWACVKVLSESVAQLPLHLYRRLPDGSPERADDHPVEALLVQAPNPWTTGTEFRQGLQSQLSLWGNAYAYVNRGETGIAEIVPLPSSSVSVMIDSVSMAPVYRFTNGAGQVRDFDRSEMLHIHGIGTSLYQGDSPVSRAANAIGLAMLMEKQLGGLFANGLRPSGNYTIPQFLKDDQRKRYKEILAEVTGRTGSPMLLEGGATYIPLTFNSTDAQFLEMRKFAIMEISRTWRVPLHMLSDLERVTFSNAEAMGQQFLSFTLLPILRQWTDALRLTLLTPEERAQGLFFDFTVDDVARADLLARMTAYSQAINCGLLNPNEARAMDNRGPYNGGDVFTRPVTVAPIDPATGKVLVPITENLPAGASGTPNAGPVQPEANLVH